MLRERERLGLAPLFLFSCVARSAALWRLCVESSLSSPPPVLGSLPGAAASLFARSSQPTNSLEGRGEERGGAYESDFAPSPPPIRGLLPSLGSSASFPFFFSFLEGKSITMLSSSDANIKHTARRITLLEEKTTYGSSFEGLLW